LPNKKITNPITKVSNLMTFVYVSTDNSYTTKNIPTLKKSWTN